MKSSFARAKDANWLLDHYDELVARDAVRRNSASVKQGVWYKGPRESIEVLGGQHAAMRNRAIDKVVRENPRSKTFDNKSGK